MLVKEDLIDKIREYRLDQITDGDDELVNNAMATAESMISNYLHGPGYDTVAIMSGRDLTVLNWAKYIALYQLYERIPDEQVPERVVKNYDDTLSSLRQASDGRLSLNLPRRYTPEGKKKTKFRWGGTPRRSN